MSDHGYIEMAKWFAERNNPVIMTVGIGKVLSPLPDIQIQFGEKIILTSEELVISASLVDGYKGKYKDIYYINGVKQEDEKEVIVTMELVAGDEVILIPTSDKQTFYVMGKVGA